MYPQTRHYLFYTVVFPEFTNTVFLDGKPKMALLNYRDHLNSTKRRKRYLARVTALATENRCASVTFRVNPSAELSINSNKEQLTVRQLSEW